MSTATANGTVKTTTPVKARKVITQAQLEEFYEAGQSKKKYDGLRKRILATVSSGGNIHNGTRQGQFALDVLHLEQVRPDWKKILTEHIGEEEIQKIIEKTQPKSITKLTVRRLEDDLLDHLV